jgi:hypothetical protein
VYGFHASLLPALAGPAPVNWAIIQGLRETGTTLLRYTRDVDGGTNVAQAACPVDLRETPATLYSKLARLSASLWLQHWPRIAAGDVAERPMGRLLQNLRRRPEDGLIRWADHSAATLDRWVRGLSRPYPGAYFWLAGRRIWIHASEPEPASQASDSAILESAEPDQLTVLFADGRVRLSDLRLDQDTPVPAHLMAQLAEHAGKPLTSLHRGRRILAIAAHPDDEVLGVGGTLIRHFKAGDEVRVLIVCSAHSIRYADGEHDQPGDAQRAAHYLGARTNGLGFPDQRLDAGSNLELIQALEQQDRDFEPRPLGGNRVFEASAELRFPLWWIIDGVAFVAINSNDIENYPDDSPDKMKQEKEQFGYPFPYLFDATQEVAKAYKAACTPDFFLFDAGRRLVYRGQFDDSRPGNDEPITGRDLREAVDADRLKAAWNRVAARHEPFRTRFRWDGAESPTQEVLSRVQLDVDVLVPSAGSDAGCATMVEWSGEGSARRRSISAVSSMSSPFTTGWQLFGPPALPGTPPPVITSTRVYACRLAIRLVTTLKKITGEIIGTVTCQNRIHQPAPSSRAASYSVGEIPWRPAR